MNTEDRIFNRQFFRVVIPLCLGLWILWPSLVIWLLPDWSERGQLGDIYGGANALFSAAAFAGIIYTILLQRRELSLQRNELELTRSELKRSADAQEKSEKAIKLQNRLEVIKMRFETEKIRTETQIKHHTERHAGTPPSGDNLQHLLRRLDDLTAEANNLQILPELHKDTIIVKGEDETKNP